MELTSEGQDLYQRGELDISDVEFFAKIGSESAIKLESNKEKEPPAVTRVKILQSHVD